VNIAANPIEVHYPIELKQLNTKTIAIYSQNPALFFIKKA